jgi:DNA-binding NarL/FixJ family response regulator
LVDTPFKVVHAAEELDDDTIEQFATSPTCIWMIAVDECRPSTHTLIQHVKKIAPNIKPVILTRLQTADDILPALEVGACGFLSQDITRARLIKSLELIMLGETVIPVQLFRTGNWVQKSNYHSTPKRPPQAMTAASNLIGAGAGSGPDAPVQGSGSSQNGPSSTNGLVNVGSVGPLSPGLGNDGHSGEYDFETESEPDVRESLNRKGSTSTDLMCNLSKRETSILRRLVEGASNKIIARQLVITEATVKVHIKAILRKLRLHNRTQAAIWASEHLSVEDVHPPLVRELAAPATNGTDHKPRLSS